ncbi:MAG: hypothetical protein NTV49_14205, partial [Kiritimatiellaeota bacterium]|nr:hypothetical protein [Kiritimatiellota bacterium]
LSTDFHRLTQIFRTQKAFGRHGICAHPKNLWIKAPDFSHRAEKFIRHFAPEFVVPTNIAGFHLELRKSVIRSAIHPNFSAKILPAMSPRPPSC